MKPHRLIAALLCLAWWAPALPADEFSAVVHGGLPLELSLPVDGRVSRVAVAPGDEVRAGTLLLQLDARAVDAWTATLRKARAQYQARLEEARREFDRQQDLYDRTLLSERDLQLARIDLMEAETIHAAVEADLADARRLRDAHELRSPVAGRVLAVSVVPGQYVVNRERPAVLVRLARHDRLLALARIPAETAWSLAPGDVLPARQGDARLTARIEGLDPLGNGHWRLRLSLPADDDLTPGTVLQLRLP